METQYPDRHVELVEKSRRGERKAQFELYKLYAKGMYNVALRILNHEAEAEDVLQEAFLDAFSAISAFRQETSFGFWLKQIVVNKSINCLRRRRIPMVSMEDMDFADTGEPDMAELELKVTAVKAAVAALPDGYRVVLSLYLFEGYDHEEIAHILKISESTSRSQYLRAKKKLNELLKERSIK